MKKRLLVEFIGTFFLVLVIGLSGNPIAVGAVLVALVYMGGYISGANYNPAVSLALWMNKKLTTDELARYIPTQLLAGLVASFFLRYISGKAFDPGPGKGVGYGPAALVEVLFTFLLASVVLHVAATDKTKNNQYYGLAIGLTVLAAAWAGGAISGGVFNPAVAVGPLLFAFPSGNADFATVVLYACAPTLGGVLAGWVYKTIKA